MGDIVSRGGISSSSGLQKPQGNGFLINVRGKLFTAMLRFAYPVFIEAPDGIKGDPVIQVRTSLGEARDINLAVAGDNPIRIEAYMCILHRMRMGLANGTPGNVVAELWTGANATGTKLGTLTAADFAGLTDRMIVVSKTFPEVPSMVDYVYVRVTTPNPTPLTVSFWWYGDILIANDTRGMPR